MLSRKKHITGRERGISLVELLVGLAVGSLIVAGALTVFAKISFSGLENVRMVRLNEQLRNTLGVMRREIQRAGYVDAWPPGSTTPADLDLAAMGDFGAITLGGTCDDYDGDGADECTCILYSYDADGDGAKPTGLDAGKEDFGFRLNDGAIERDTTAATCANGEDITDGEVIIRTRTVVDGVEIPGLLFELDPSSTIVELNDGVGNDDDACESGEVCLARRKINVLLEGELSADSDFTVRLRDEIKVKNDHYFTMP